MQRKLKDNIYFFLPVDVILKKMWFADDLQIQFLYLNIYLSFYFVFPKVKIWVQSAMLHKHNYCAFPSCSENAMHNLNIIYAL